MSWSVQTFTPEEISDDQIRAVTTLWMKIWPGDETTFEEFIARFARRTRERPDRLIHIVFAETQAIAAAESFSRIIHTPVGSLPIHALAGVCSEPSRRGQGLGDAVVRSALSRVDQGVFHLSLFQTDVPKFYERLGARTVSNVFHNRKDAESPEANPFWGSHIMIYPADRDWPDGVIDLNGPGY